MVTKKKVGPAEAAFAAHADTCPRLCGINFKPGQCAEGDKLAKEMDREEEDTRNGYTVTVIRGKRMSIISRDKATLCPLCGVSAVVPLTVEQRESQPDATTHVCHPGFDGCNHGFEMS